MQIRSLQLGEQHECEAVLRSLPDWFGIDESLLQYVADAGDIAKFQTTFAIESGRAIGFITIRRHFPESAEVHCFAVRPELHRRGVGRALLSWVECILRGVGTRFLQVKTMGPSRPSEFYARTLSFYRGVGFSPLEEIHGLWGKIPCLILVKDLQVAPVRDS